MTHLPTIISYSSPMTSNYYYYRYYPYYYHYNFCHFQYQGLRLPPAAATTTTPASSTTTPRHPQFHPIVILTFDKLDSYLLHYELRSA